MDTATSDIRAVEFTPSGDGDSPVLPELLDQIPQDEQIGTVTADGAYDTRRCHTAIIERQATAIIPIRKNGRLWKEDCPAAKARNETLRASRDYGRAFWKRWTGDHARSRVEAKMRCLKACGERISARDPDRQTAEIQIRVALMNRFSALGTAEIVRVEGNQRGKGKSRFKPQFCNNAHGMSDFWATARLMLFDHRSTRLTRHKAGTETAGKLGGRAAAKAQLFDIRSVRHPDEPAKSLTGQPRPRTAKSMPYSCSPYPLRLTGPENIGPERMLPGLLWRRPVNSPTRITLENNGKIRP